MMDFNDAAEFIRNQQSLLDTFAPAQTVDPADLELQQVSSSFKDKGKEVERVNEPTVVPTVEELPEGPDGGPAEDT